MKDYPRVILKPGKEAALKRYHPWLFSGAVRTIRGSVKEGDTVEVFSEKNEYLGTGHWQEGSIAVKIFSFQQADIDYEFWKSKISAAFGLRKSLGLVNNDLTNAYRLVNSEADGIPGLIVDFYNGDAVIQANSTGIRGILAEITEILKVLYGNELSSVYDKSEFPIPPGGRIRGGDRGGIYLYGSPHETYIREMGHHFFVDRKNGQKTGFFLDQRGNRMFAQFYARDRKVLNAFCYSGAFSVYAIKGGASLIHSIDSSRQAIDWAVANLKLNEIDPSKHLTEVADVNKFLSTTKEKYDMIILDPPAFAKSHTVTHNALQAYIYINAEALKRLNRGGILFTFSCSQAISRDMFRSAVLTSALEADREIKILHHLSQGPDHPVSIFHPEGEYLSGLILSAE